MKTEHDCLALAIPALHPDPYAVCYSPACQSDTRDCSDTGDRPERERNLSMATQLLCVRPGLRNISVESFSLAHAPLWTTASYLNKALTGLNGRSGGLGWVGAGKERRQRGVMREAEQ